MATVVQTATGHLIPAGTTRTLTFPNAVTAGNTIIVAVTAYDSANAVTWSVTDNKNGATVYTVADYVSAVITGAERENAGIVYIENTAGSTGANSFIVSIAFTHGDVSNASVCSAMEVSGLKTSSSIDRHNNNSQISSSTSANVANTLANQSSTGLSVATMVLYAGSATEGISLTGYTNVDVIQDGNSANPSSVDYKVLSATETTSVTYTHSHSLQTGWVAALSTFQDVGGAPPVVPLSSLTVMRQFPQASPLNPNQYRQKPRAFALTLAAAGTSGLVFGQTGALTGAGALTGTPALTFGQTGAITGQGALAGSSALVFGQTGTLTQPGLVGTSALVFGQTGALTASGVLAGTSALQFGQTGALTGAGALAGTSALTFAQTGTITAAGILAGASALTFAQTAALSASGALAGTSALTFGASATADLPAGALVGTATLSIGQSGTLTGAGDLAGLATLVFGAIGTNSIVVSQPGPVDSPRIAEGAFRRRKKKKRSVIEQLKAQTPPTSVLITAAPVATPAMVAKQPRDPRSLAQIVGATIAPEGVTPEHEEDDQEALNVILRVLELGI